MKTRWNGKLHIYSLEKNLFLNCMKQFYIDYIKNVVLLVHFFQPVSICSVSSHCVLSPTVRIGAMLAYTPLDEKSLALLLSYLQDFLK